MNFKDKMKELKDIITSSTAAANDAYNHAWHATHAYDAIEVDKDKYNASFNVASAAFDVADVAIDAAKEAINEAREKSNGH